jgi:hypothetical protein
MGEEKKVVKRTKTSIDIEEDLWKEFSTVVIKKVGLRKKNVVLEKLIKEYVDNNK